MKNIILATTVIILMLTLAACQQTDVVGNKSIESFNAILNVNSENIIEDTEIGGFAMISPNGTEEFILNKNVQIKFEVEPFLNAGLDISKLPKEMIDGNYIVIGAENNDYKEGLPKGLFENFIRNNREKLGYHTALDHFGINFGDGNAFEFAKDIDKNGKDIVFVINPKMFIDAGVDVENIDGWLFTKVEMMGKGGKITQEDRLLKPYNIK